MLLANSCLKPILNLLGESADSNSATSFIAESYWTLVHFETVNMSKERDMVTRKHSRCRCKYGKGVEESSDRVRYKRMLLKE